VGDGIRVESASNTLAPAWSYCGRCDKTGGPDVGAWGLAAWALTPWAAGTASESFDPRRYIEGGSVVVTGRTEGGRA
jgi:hypothetical protein